MYVKCYRALVNPFAPRFQDALRPILRGPLPVRLRARDRSLAGPPTTPTVVLTGPRALRRPVWHPGELGAGIAGAGGGASPHPRP